MKKKDKLNQNLALSPEKKNHPSKKKNLLLKSQRLGRRRRPGPPQQGRAPRPRRERGLHGLRRLHRRRGPAQGADARPQRRRGDSQQPGVDVQDVLPLVAGAEERVRGRGRVVGGAVGGGVGSGREPGNSLRRFALGLLLFSFPATIRFLLFSFAFSLALSISCKLVCSLRVNVKKMKEKGKKKKVVFFLSQRLFATHSLDLPALSCSPPPFFFNRPWRKQHPSLRPASLRFSFGSTSLLGTSLDLEFGSSAN